MLYGSVQAVGVAPANVSSERHGCFTEQSGNTADVQHLFAFD